MVVPLSICLLSASIVVTCIAAYFALCRALIMIKKSQIVKIDVECFDLIKWFVLVLWCDAFVVIVLSDEPGQNQGRGLVDRKLVKAPQ